MTTEECLEIVKKLDDISQNKFYTINVYDTVRNNYLGDSELVFANAHYSIIHSWIGANSKVYTVTYRFHKDGNYEREWRTHGQISNILSRLNKIEQQLGI